MLPVIGADFTLQRLERVLRAPGGIVPALEGRNTELDWLTTDRVAPGLGGKKSELMVKFTTGWRGGQEPADDTEAKAGPTL